MKTEFIAALSQLTDLINALPADPAPTPTGLAVTNHYVMGVPPDSLVLAFGLGWDDTQPNPARLYWKSAEGNPNGPQDWTMIDTPINNGAGANGERYTHTLSSPTGQSLLFRLVAVNADSVESAPLEITVNADDYLS